MRHFSLLIIFWIGFGALSIGGINIDSLKQMLPSVDGYQKAGIYNELFSAYELISYEKAIQYAQQAKIEAELSRNIIELGTALKNIGKIHYHLQNNDSAKFYFSKSLEMYLMADDSAGMAKIYNNLGLLHSNEGKYKVAVTYYQQSLELKKALKDSLGIANSYINIGAIYYQIENYELANDYYQDGLFIAGRINNLLTMQSALGNLGLIYKETGNLEKALESHTQSLDINNTIGNIPGVAASLVNIGQVYLVQNRFDEALDYFLRAQNLNDSYGIKEATTLNSIGQVYAEMENPDQALFYFHRAWDQAKETRRSRILFIASQNLYITYANIGEYELAFGYSLQTLALQDSFSNELLNGEILKQESQYKLEKMNKEIDQLSSDNEAMDEKIESVKTQKDINQLVNYLLGAALLILIVMIVINTRLSKKGKAAVVSLKQSDNRLRSLIDSSDDMVCYKDAKGVMLELNTAFEQFYEFGRSELKGLNRDQLNELNPLFSDLINVCYELDLQAWENGSSFKKVVSFDYPNGPTRNLEFTKIPVLADSGERLGMITTIKAEPVSPLVESNDQVSGSQLEKDLSFINLLADSSVLLDGAGNCIKANLIDKSIRFKIIEKGHYKEWGMEDDLLSRFEAGYVSARNNVKSSLEYSQQIAENDLDAYEMLFRPYNDSVLLTIVKKSSEEKPDDSGGLYKQIFGKFDVPAVVCNASGLVKEINQSGRLLLKTEPEEAINLFELLPDDAVSQFMNSVEPMLERKNQLIRIKSGKAVRVEMKAYRILHASEPFWFIILNDLEDRIKLEKSINDIRQRAADNEKSNTFFLANMSHEIRTPLNTIIGFSNLVAEAGLPDEQKQLYIKNISKSGNALLHLIEDLIDYSKIDSGQITLNEEVCQLNEFFSDFYSFFTDTQSEKLKDQMEFRVKINSTDQALSFYTDVLRLKQVMSNMISNAFKFTKEGHIDIGFSLLESDEVEFFVEDTGRGIAVDKLEYIFDRFGKTDFSPIRDGGGSGLGLTISKKLINLMGGSVHVESREGAGSRFSFRLPFKPVQTEKTGRESEVLTEAGGQSWQDKQILIAEDVEPNYQLLKSFLRKTKATLHWAKDGREAVELCSQIPIDIVIMDIQMPVMNGIDAMKIIKKDHPNLPIIAQTAYALADDRPKILDYGFDDYIAKPIKVSTLLKMIAQQLEKAKK